MSSVFRPLFSRGNRPSVPTSIRRIAATELLQAKDPGPSARKKAPRSGSKIDAAPLLLPSRLCLSRAARKTLSPSANGHYGAPCLAYLLFQVLIVSTRKASPHFASWAQRKPIEEVCAVGGSFRRWVTSQRSDLHHQPPPLTTFKVPASGPFGFSRGLF